MFGVDERGNTAALLGRGDHMQREGGFTGGFRPVDLDHATARHAADAEGGVERDRPGGDHVDVGPFIHAHPHDRALAELALNLGECGFEGFFAVVVHCAYPVNRD